MAGYLAKWGIKGFLISPDKIVPFNNLSTSFALKSENNTDTSGTAPTNTRGRELQTITFTTTYMTATGVDPRKQMKEWYALVGKTYPLYIGGEQFGPPLLQLEKVDWNNYQFAPNGKIISADASITLKEYSGNAQKLDAQTLASFADSSINRTQSSINADNVLKAAVLSIEPTSEQKQNKKIV